MTRSTFQVSFPIGRSPITTVLVRAHAFPCRVGVKDTGDEIPSRPQAVRWAHRPNKQGLRLNYLLRFRSCFPFSPHSPSISYRIVPHLKIAIPAFTHSRRYCFLLTVTHSPHQPHTSSPLNDVTISRTYTSFSINKPLQNALLFRPGAEHPRHRPGRRC